MLGRPGLESRRAQEVLRAAGHVIATCRDGRWGCAGLDDDCPLDEIDVDVAVAIAEPSDRFDPQGIACLHRARIPIVAIGATDDDPVRDFASVTVELLDADIVAAVESAARDASGHRRAVDELLRGRLGQDEHVDVAVVRRSDAVAVRLTTDLDSTRSAALADLARAAVRTHDRRVRVIDVSVAGPSAEAAAAPRERGDR